MTYNDVLNIISENVNLSKKINWGNFHFKNLAPEEEIILSIPDLNNARNETELSL